MRKYPLHVTKVIDGDTIKGLIDLNFNILLKAKIRLANINCPELNTPEGIKSKDWLKEKIEGKDIFVESNSFGKYGRVLGKIYLKEDDSKDLNTILLEEGLAVPYTLREQKFF